MAKNGKFLINFFKKKKKKRFLRFGSVHQFFSEFLIKIKRIKVNAPVAGQLPVAGQSPLF